MSDHNSVWLGRINTLCAVVGAGAAIWIPIVLHNNAQRSRNNDNHIAQQTRTWQVMDELDQRISAIIGKKITLDKRNKVSDAESFTSRYIDDDKNRDVQLQVFRLLNLYESICTGAEVGLLSKEIIEKMRGDALRETWRDYRSYISDHRKKEPSTRRAWDSCDVWIAQESSSLPIPLATSTKAASPGVPNDNR
ncbi:DUF4760 domain-containing protein [Allomesorhizobium camelthorni]|uniref:DUF4760 domain-containing protein n=1 Tax=Allomesorhizobium camelthorni TaxID=475069 RepID=A0A6G4W9Y7_9HYPH|nr:hypothetical protein [Mesorhizobium camelthorni]NGO51592.1 hypothetical protein [Mesorhizobium camelthorni]